MEDKDSKNFPISAEQLNQIELNLKLTVDERIAQLQSAVTLIEELRAFINEQNS